MNILKIKDNGEVVIEENNNLDVITEQWFSFKENMWYKYVGEQLYKRRDKNEKWRKQKSR